MSDDSRLAALWDLDEPPMQDPAFVLATLERLARRRFRMNVARLLPPLIATIAVCWGIAPSVEVLLQSGYVAVVIAALSGAAIAAIAAKTAATS